MFSPQDRIYNTPDVSVPAAEAILQQIRLERILKRFGYFACGNPIIPSKHAVAPPLVTLGPPPATRALRPFGAHEAFTGWQSSKNIQIPKPKKCQVSPRSGIPGAPIDDPYLQKQRETIGGNKYGGVHLTRYDLKDDIQRPDIFKPFQPQRSPQRLPAIQRTKSKDAQIIDPESILPETVIHKHLELQKKSKNKEIQKRRLKEERKSKKKRKREMEFMKWEENHDKYLEKPISYLSAIPIQPEERYRERIATEIKRGVQEKMKSFGKHVRFAKTDANETDAVPVLELEFQNKTIKK